MKMADTRRFWLPRAHGCLLHVWLLCLVLFAVAAFENLAHWSATVATVDTALLLASSVFAGPPQQTQRSPLGQCDRYDPIFVSYEHIDVPTNASISNANNTLFHQPMPRICGRLRRNWDYKTLQTELAHRIQSHQSNCTAPVMNFYLDNLNGLGAHLNLWSQALCNAWEHGHRVRTINENWLWKDSSLCAGNDDDDNDNGNPFACYFPNHQSTCLADQAIKTAAQMNVSDPRNPRWRCLWVRDREALRDFRAASMEYTFANLSPLVVREAQRQVGLLFAEGVAPPNMISVHVRWGDKFWEMDLPKMDDYIAAIRVILQKRGDQDDVHIYLATEDPRAVREFQAATPLHWHIYVDRTVTELDSFRPAKGNRASWTTRNTNGRAGLVALGSLLVALEANAFVLTTQSNWSRLLNQLRTNLVEPRDCNRVACTTMIDLRPGDW